MSKITVTTDEGIVVEEFCPEEEWGDINQSLPCAEMVKDMRQAIKWAQEEEVAVQEER